MRAILFRVATCGGLLVASACATYSGGPSWRMPSAVPKPDERGDLAPPSSPSVVVAEREPSRAITTSPSLDGEPAPEVAAPAPSRRAHGGKRHRR